jgi:hypothetical protein
MFKKGNKMTKQDEPAYPPFHDPNTHCFGLTKRELFAAMAMQGLMCYLQEIEVKALAHNAVMSADALISELNK